MDLAAYKIVINPTGLSGAAARTYTNKVHEHLRWIYRTQTGKLLLKSIKFYNHPLLLLPTQKVTATPSAAELQSAETEP